MSPIQVFFLPSLKSVQAFGVELQSGINQLNQVIEEKGVYELVIAGKEKRESKKVIVK